MHTQAETHTHTLQERLQHHLLSSSFTHSFLPCIPPGARLTPRTADPPYFIHNNPCLFLVREHTLSRGCRERQEWRKGLKAIILHSPLTLVCFQQRLGHEKPFRDEQQGLYTVLVYEFMSASQWERAPDLTSAHLGLKHPCVPTMDIINLRIKHSRPNWCLICHE